MRLHVITHSHLDAGWVKDLETCYSVVKNIFSSVLLSLSYNDQRKYSVGDLYFFERWFNNAIDDIQREEVRRLVKNGQIEILHGGSVSPDEATTTFDDVIDN